MFFHWNQTSRPMGVPLSVLSPDATYLMPNTNQVLETPKPIDSIQEDLPRVNNALFPGTTKTETNDVTENTRLQIDHMILTSDFFSPKSERVTIQPKNTNSRSSFGSNASISLTNGDISKQKPLRKCCSSRIPRHNKAAAPVKTVGKMPKQWCWQHSCEMLRSNFVQRKAVNDYRLVHIPARYFKYVVEYEEAYELVPYVSDLKDTDYVPFMLTEYINNKLLQSRVRKRLHPRQIPKAYIHQIVKSQPKFSLYFRKYLSSKRSSAEF